MTAPTMDQKKGTLVPLDFNTVNANNAAINPTVAGTVSVFENDNPVAIATDAHVSVTYVLGFGGLTGYHVVFLDTSDDLYTAENNYRAVVTGMTIDGFPSVPLKVGNFNISAVNLDDIWGTQFEVDKYAFSTGTVPPPADAVVQVNNAVYANVTEIYISEKTQSGSSAVLWFDALKIGDKILIAKRTDPTKFILMSVNADPQDDGTWWTIPVSVEDSGDLIADGNNVNVALRFMPQPDVVSQEDWLQAKHRLQIDGPSTAPATNTPANLQVDAGKVASIDGLTGDEAMRLIAAASAGLLSGATSTTVTIMGVNGSITARITATVDADGNRTGIVIDVTP